ncbi:hypothetical protein [Glycomyces terrestris]|uniref:Uncharacterized protein n=1 Tax=Glycomyces terrestris TaxID=2493553 RepID=A0A426V182_9ACTN|nr:hypothetical protein [Glycomyces terrestris]RRS00610.1 hypothetical protein EIW28_08645 [Glycomyces terrestris]
MTSLDPYLSAAVSVISAVAMTTQAWLLYRAYRYQNETERMKIVTDEHRRAVPEQSREPAIEQGQPTGDTNANDQIQRF